MATQPGIRTRPPSFAESRSYRLGYDEGYDRGTRAGVAADRLWWLAVGFVCGAGLVALARYL